MIYITGDTHGDFSRFEYFCRENNTSKDDIMIILGDVGLNFYLDWHDDRRKQFVEKLPLTFFGIHGNHEQRPFAIASYKTKEFHGGLVWYEEEYPDILFAKDGEIYNFDGYECIVIGGAYSVDKDIKALHGLWFANEQPSKEIKEYVESQLAKRDYKIDVVLSHTCPLDYQPIEVFLSGIDQKSVDSSTEEWLNEIEHKLDYQKWYCGHYHTSKRLYNVQMMFEEIEKFTVE